MKSTSSSMKRMTHHTRTRPYYLVSSHIQGAATAESPVSASAGYWPRRYMAVFSIFSSESLCDTLDNTSFISYTTHTLPRGVWVHTITKHKGNDHGFIYLACSCRKTGISTSGDA